jgi:hypothetical protein
MGKFLSCVVVAVQLFCAFGITEVEYVTAEFRGEDYRRLIEPMAEFIPEEATCATSQVLR